MTPSKIAELRALIAAAAPGPWTVAPYNGGCQVDAPGCDDCLAEMSNGSNEDAAFIAASRTALPEALDEIERLNKILWGVVANAGRLSHKEKPRWSHVSDTTGNGRTVSTLLCSDHGFDPHLIVGGSNPACSCTSGALTPEDTCPLHGVDDDAACDQCDEYEAEIEEHLPEYVLDDGTDEPANYLERIEYAGREARRSIKYRDERDALKARVAKLEATVADLLKCCPAPEACGAVLDAEHALAALDEEVKP